MQRPIIPGPEYELEFSLCMQQRSEHRTFEAPRMSSLRQLECDMTQAAYSSFQAEPSRKLCKLNDILSDVSCRLPPPALRAQTAMQGWPRSPRDGLDSLVIFCLYVSLFYL